MSTIITAYVTKRYVTYLTRIGRSSTCKTNIFVKTFKMKNGFTKNTENPLILILGWAVSFIFFLVGFYHTGQGLQSYKVLGMEYGSYLISFGILMLMVISYTKAVTGSKLALALYVLFALVNFTCNLNSFYPNDQGEFLYKKELEEKKLALTAYQSEIDKKFINKNVLDRVRSAENLLSQLSEQILDGGFREKSNLVVDQIEDVLGLNRGSITRLSAGNGNYDYERIADTYNNIIGDRVKKYMAANGFNSSAIKKASDLKSQYTPLLDKKIKNPFPLIDRENLQNIRTSDYLIRDLVSKMKNLRLEAQDEAKALKINLNLPEQKYKNDEFGKFSHTFRAIRENTSEAGTWYVIIICLLIDFIIPISMYFLIRKKDGEKSNNPWDRFFGQDKLKSF